MSSRPPATSPRVVLAPSQRPTWAAAAAGLIFTFVISGAPIPLMSLYRESGLGTTDFAHASVAYFSAAALGLLFLGRLSTTLGRRWASVATLLVGTLGCILMIDVHGAVGLVVARGFQGLACGMAPGALGAWVVDAAGRDRRWSTVVTGSAPMIGLPLGALASGAGVHFGVLDQRSVFLLLAGLTGGLGLLLAFCSETVQERTRAAAALRPRLTLPTGRGKELGIAMAVLVATWPLGSFYQAYGSIVAADLLGSDSLLVAGGIFASIMILNPVGGSLSALVSARWSVMAGLVGFGVALAIAIVALWHENPVIFTACSLVCGVAQGAAATGSMRLLLPHLVPADRAGVLATLYFVAFGSVGLCSLVGGWVAARADLEVVAVCYATLGWLTVTIGILLARREGSGDRHGPAVPTRRTASRRTELSTRSRP